MLSTIKSKIIVLTCGLLCLLSLILTGVAFYAFYHDKDLIVAGNNNSITAFAGQLNQEISELSKQVRDLALIGEIFYQNGQNQKVGEYAVRNILTNYPRSLGCGIWFKPYMLSADEKRRCIYATWNSAGQPQLLPALAGEDYNYLGQQWYTDIMPQLEHGRSLVWAKPYHGKGVHTVMTTVGSGIYAQGRLIGLATVDWQMDGILKSILKIKPTSSSFVLFADKQNDSIIATTDPNISVEEVMGHSLNKLSWYTNALADGVPFEYHHRRYLPYIKQLDNGMILIVNVPLDELFRNNIRYLHLLLGVFLSGTVLIAGLLYWVLKRNINQPILQLTQMAQKIGQGDLDLVIQLQRPLELARLAAVLNQMTTDIKKHLMTLAHVSAEKERIEAELQIARTIQNAVLPKDFPVNESFELVASMTPAREVGGDFYDFFPIDAGHYAFVMADVSGKGVSAALLMMSAKSIIKSALLTVPDLAEAAHQINATLCDSHARGMFVTAFIGVLDIKTGRVDYINAGHCPPLHKTKTGYDFVPVVRDLVFGITPSYDYTLGHFVLNPTDRLFLYTDGVTEAQTKSEKLYGSDRLQKILNASKPTDTLARVRQGIKRFTQGAAQSDDITMMELVFKRRSARIVKH